MFVKLLLAKEVYCSITGMPVRANLARPEINAASSVSAVIYSSLFDLTSTYFMVAGIAGFNPHVATTGSVAFSRYAVQVDLQSRTARSANSE